MRASHLHFMVSHAGCRTLVTHIFVRGDTYLDADTVFGVKESLVKDFVRQEPGTPTPDGREIATPGPERNSTSSSHRQTDFVATNTPDAVSGGAAEPGWKWRRQ